jgi:hypothetical protein
MPSIVSPLPLLRLQTHSAHGLRPGAARRYFASMMVIRQRLDAASSSTDRTMPVNIRALESIVPDIDTDFRSSIACRARSARFLSVT